MRLVLILTAAALIGCAESTTTAPVTPAETSATAFELIETEAAFTSLVVGKRLNFEGGRHFTIFQDGTLSGDFDGPLAGTWEWRDGTWCRVLTQPARAEDCQTWETDGTTFRATRSNGTAFLYTL